jgi:hypothetical protein
MGELKLPTGRGRKYERECYQFAQQLEAINPRIGFKLSPRGWCYQLEVFGLIDKSQFDKVEKLVNGSMDAGKRDICPSISPPRKRLGSLAVSRYQITAHLLNSPRPFWMHFWNAKNSTRLTGGMEKNTTSKWS